MRRSLVLASSLLLAACKTADPAPPVASEVHAAPIEPAPLAVDTSRPMPPGLVEAYLDPQVSPCTDFYQYACGGWMKQTEIPPDRERISTGFIALEERNLEVLKGLLEQAAAKKLPAGTAYAKQIGDYYATCLDEAKLEKSLSSVKKELRAFDNLSHPKALAQVLGDLHQRGVFPLFNIGVGQDFKDATQVIGDVDQGGLGLPERDYYLVDDPKMKAVRDEYAAHIARVFELLGEKPPAAQKASQDVMAFETALARASQTNVARREPANVYHRLDRAGLQQRSPSFPWDGYFTRLGAPGLQAINVDSPEFIDELERQVKAAPPALWKTYLTWHFLHGTVLALPKAFQEEDFRYRQKALSGAAQDKARWKKCVTATRRDLAQAVGKLFVEKTFGADGKATTQAMVDALVQAFERNLSTLTWMDAPTQAQARLKAQQMSKMIGYPDKWRDYASYKTDRDSFLGNVLRARAFEMRRQLAKVGKPVDMGDWLMAPSEVNAYNEGTKNQIVFAAGILQPPYFSREATAPVNFGGIGMVAGHEITHGFDDEGRQFDATGSLRDWWSPASGKAFVERTACVKKQYDGYLAIEDIHLNGSLTLGENVADLGGIKLAHAAMVQWEKDKPSAAGATYRYTPSQQFFLGFAQAWCLKMRPEVARLFAKTDPHSPPYWRVNGPLSNSPEFQQAFSCPATAKMVRSGASRCAVW